MELRKVFQHQGNVKFNFSSISEGFRTIQTLLKLLGRYFDQNWGGRHGKRGDEKAKSLFGGPHCTSRLELYLRAQEELEHERACLRHLRCTC